MSFKAGETHLHNWTIDAIVDNRRAPFGDKASLAFASLSALLALLPKPPATILDAGCANGWLTEMLTKQGYTVTGIDPCEAEITWAKFHRKGLYLVGDYDNLPSNLYDVIVFNESLHHSMNRQITLQSAFNALKSGGLLVAIEPGLGHGMTKVSRDWARTMDVTERSCPPVALMWTGSKIGFRCFRIYPSLYTIVSAVYSKGGHLRENIVSKCLRWLPFKMTFLSAAKPMHGITTMKKP